MLTKIPLSLTFPPPSDKPLPPTLRSIHGRTHPLLSLRSFPPFTSPLAPLGPRSCQSICPPDPFRSPLPTPSDSLSARISRAAALYERYFAALLYKPKVKNTFTMLPVRNLHANTPPSLGASSRRPLPSPGAYLRVPSITFASFVMGG